MIPVAAVRRIPPPCDECGKTRGHSPTCEGRARNTLLKKHGIDRDRWAVFLRVLSKRVGNKWDHLK